MSVTALIKQMPTRQQKAGKYLAGFFALILVLTLVSRGLDSYSIPVVTAVRLGSGSIGHQIKAQGTVEPMAQVAVAAPAGHLVESLLVEEGSKVEEGDTLALLSLSALEEKLEDARRELEIARLNAAAEQLYVPDNSADLVLAAERALERALEDLEQAKEDGETAVSRAGRDVSDARRERRKLRDDDADDEELSEIKKTIEALERQLEDAHTGAQKGEQSARRAVEDARQWVEDALLAQENTGAKAAVEQQRRSINSRIRQLEAQSKEQEVARLEALVEAGGRITAPRGGVVTGLNISPGAVTGGDGILLLSDQTRGAVLRATLEDAEGEKLSRGDRGELTVGTRTVSAAVSALKPPVEKGKGYEISVFTEEPLETGLTGTFAIEKTSRSYSQVVPMSALHSKGGSSSVGYVLVLREKIPPWAYRRWPSRWM